SMSARRTSWIEFNSAMASAVIYFSTGDDAQERSIPSPTPPTPPPQQSHDIPSTSQSMSARRTSWIEFNSAMASAVIYFST
nr:hypothetical protein [Tanacetum cinerariifolium]